MLRVFLTARRATITCGRTSGSWTTATARSPIVRPRDDAGAAAAEVLGRQVHRRRTARGQERTLTFTTRTTRRRTIRKEFARIFKLGLVSDAADTLVGPQLDVTWKKP
jgi:hypothetical protein